LSSGPEERTHIEGDKRSRNNCWHNSKETIHDTTRTGKNSISN
jgi:hypothetical protein